MPDSIECEEREKVCTCQECAFFFKDQIEFTIIKDELMNKCLLLLAMICFLHDASGKKPFFRTDGYYYYDNHCDTLFLINTKDPKAKQWVRLFTGTGMVIDDSVSCAPKHCLPLGGGSQVRILAFYSDKKGLSITHACLNETNWKLAMAKIERLRHDTNVVKRNPYYFTVQSIRNGQFVLQEPGADAHSRKTVTGKIYEDKLVVKYHFMVPGFEASSEKVFRFYPFSRIPPMRKKLINVYPDLSKWESRGF